MKTGNQNNPIQNGSERLPRHVAIIMDGNGRWARRKGLDRSEGHFKGVESVRAITRAASDAGIDYLSLYAFSTENWQRPPQEVDTLMYLIGYAIEKETPSLNANNVRLRLVGDVEHLPQDTRESLQRSVDMLNHNTGLTLVLCLNYSARSELTRAMKNMAREVMLGRLSPDQISEQTISSHLYTADIPDPDLLIRTGGEERISNFLLWQISYSELMFTPTLWPDFREAEFAELLKKYGSRERRFGKTSEQVKCEKQ